MPKPRFTAQQLGDYIGQCKANGGAVTINLGIYQDGTVDPRAVDVLKEVHKRASQGLPAADGYVPFDGPKTAWHGFDRYDYLMDDASGDVKPATQGAKGRQCIVVVPKKAAPGNPWSWRGCYWDHEPQTEVELLKRGFHIAFVAPDGGKQGKAWDRWYNFLTEKHGLAKKAAFIGMSKGGVNEFDWGVVNPDKVACKLLVDHGFASKPVLKGTGPKAGEAYAWAIANPGKVACIYARNPLMRSLMAGKSQPIDNLAALARAGVPILHDCGASDPWLDSQTRVVEKRYKELGGQITVIIREGEGHFPLVAEGPADGRGFHPGPPAIMKGIVSNKSQPRCNPRVV